MAQALLSRLTINTTAAVPEDQCAMLSAQGEEVRLVDASEVSYRRYLLPCLIFCSCFLYCVNSELLQALQVGGGHVSPLLNLLCCHLGGLLAAPYFLCGSGSARIHYIGENHRIVLPSLVMAGLLMGYNYCAILSFTHISASMGNAIFQSSIAFACIATSC